jgi:hypothetical protein
MAATAWFAHLREDLRTVQVCIVIEFCQFACLCIAPGIQKLESNNG